jgi:hypothetical protein
MVLDFLVGWRPTVLAKIGLQIAIDSSLLFR